MTFGEQHRAAPKLAMTSRRLVSTSLPMVARLRRPPPPSHAASRSPRRRPHRRILRLRHERRPVDALLERPPYAGLQASGRVAERFKAAGLKSVPLVLAHLN